MTTVIAKGLNLRNTTQSELNQGQPKTAFLWQAVVILLQPYVFYLILLHFMKIQEGGWLVRNEFKEC